MPQSPSNQVTVEGVELGRYLFYDTILSANYTVSCGSCHKQAFAFADTAAFSPGINGNLQVRNTPALFNLAWYPKMFYDGRAASIEEQVFHPVRQQNEMGLSWLLAVKRLKKSKRYQKLFYQAYGNVEIDSVLAAKAIGQFLRTLISYNTKLDKALVGKSYFTKQEYNGFVLMNDQTKGNCLHCHTTDADPMGTTFAFSNNGLDTASSYTGYKDKGLGATTGKPADYGKFKIPSLRNVAVTAPYMHDGRFKTLEEVLKFYSTGIKPSVNIDSKMTNAHRGGVRLTQSEQADIVAFLKTLTDSVLISTPALANPFNKGNR